MRLTIERLRWIVLVAGVLLVAALGAFLLIGKWRRAFSPHLLPQRLGINIQQDSTGFTYAPSRGGHTPYMIHAGHLVQLKDGRAMLQKVKIELYGENGDRVDRIQGDEFEYDQKAGTARATGPVEITLMRPGEAPAIAPKATPERVLGKQGKANPLAGAAEELEAGQIRVRTSGLVFDQNSGLATTEAPVEFQMTQGKGSSIGATYDSKKSTLVLDRAVELETRRRNDTVHLHAAHAEFERGSQLCHLHSAAIDARGAQAQAAEATLLFRDDGSVSHLDAQGGFTLATSSGGRLAAPRAKLDFDQRNQPRRGRLEGGVLLDSHTNLAGNERTLHGTAPTADLDFTPQGELRLAHMERGAEISSTEQAPDAAHASRTWRSPVADIDFRTTNGRMEASAIRGAGGVEVTAENQRGAQPPTFTRLRAQQVTGEFGAASTLRSMTGTGSASLEQRAATGALQTATGDRIEARLAAPAAHSAGAASAPQIETAHLEGHVTFLETPAARPGQSAPAPVRATAGRADYEGQGGWLHLTLLPRLQDSGLDLTAQKIDFSQAGGEAWAHDNVKATWSGSPAPPGSFGPGHATGDPTLGGQGPVHVVAREAQFRQVPGEVRFRGQARLWQQASSISAPEIVLDRPRRTLHARTADAADPVRTVLTGAEPPTPHPSGSKTQQPQVVRVRSGELHYSDGERKALLRSGVLPAVVAETGSATVSSAEAELFLLPVGSHPGRDAASQQVDRLVARGHVQVLSQGRHGIGEQLVYTGENGEYVLTGTASALPRITDPVRGVVTGETVIFSSRDDEVRVEGGQRKSRTETTAPR